MYPNPGSLAVLAVGSTAFDTIARTDKLPGPDEAVKADAIEAGPGGCGANVARGLARLGRTPTLLSAVGEDFAGSPAEQALQAEGVDLSHVFRAPGESTARAIVTTDAQLRQAIVYDEGSTPRMTELSPLEAPIGHFAPGELTAYPELMEPVDRVIFDPGQEVFYRPIEETLAPAEHADILVVNEHEAQRLAEAVGSIDQLAEPREALVVTHASGQTIHSEGQTTEVEAISADVVDPTGAGDAYAAGLVHGLADGLDLVEASRLGGAVAACVVERVGAQTGLPTLEQARARLDEA